MILNPGSINILTNASYTLSTGPCRVYSLYTYGAQSTTMGTLALLNGSAAGTEYVRLTVRGTGIDSWNYIDFPFGLYFPNGCYAAPNSRTTYSTITYEILP